ncbi:MAG TPA: hypothetical protein VGH67_05605 [Solirubrobacteraceae bacterium]|jgi:hypothetical protein
MRGRTTLLAVACAVAALAVSGAGAPIALAAGGNAIINDCQSTGRLSHNYTLQELRHALAVMPASVKQYTSCYDVISQGILTVRSGKKTGPTGGSGGSFLPTPVIIILVVLILAAVTFGALAIRRRRTGPDGDDAAPGGGQGPPGGGQDPPGGGQDPPGEARPPA